MTTTKGSALEVKRTPSDRRPSGISLAPFNDGSTDTGGRRTLSISLGDEFVDLTLDAKAATAAEHAMSVRDALRLYPKAVAFSMTLSLALVMEGYDTALLGAFYALPQFQEKYGRRLPDGSYQLTAAWQSGINNSGAVGSLFGLYISGIMHERYGYRKTLLAALVMMILCIFVQFFAKNIQTLLIGQIFCGICWGTFQTQTTTYAAEVTPIVLRVYLTSYVNLCWIMGQFISAGVVRALVSQRTQWSFRIPFAIQWVWPVPIIIGVVCAPESPWSVSFPISGLAMHVANECWLQVARPQGAD
jgi:SP family general alpha glucoside:H+ symporter-like MFS transporter